MPGREASGGIKCYNLSQFGALLMENLDVKT